MMPRAYAAGGVGRASRAAVIAPSLTPAARPALRAQARAQRAAMPPSERAAAARAAQDRVLALLAEVPPGAVVALYEAMGDEAGTHAIADALAARGVALAYPRTIPGHRPMEFRRCHRDDLVATRWTLREPPLTAAVVDGADLAAVVIPALLFDRRGYRLGWGAGHYDATLPACAGLWIGLGFEAQLVEDLAPEAHDVPVHWIATEVACHRGAPDAPVRGTQA